MFGHTRIAAAIRAAATAILADPPPLTDWDAEEEDGESEIFNDDVECLLHELVGWHF